MDYEYDNPDIMLEKYNPEAYSEILTAEIANPLASEACEVAADLRSEGYSPSEALKEGWRIAKGEDNPEFVPSPLLTAIVLTGIGIVVCKLWKKQWPWELLKQSQLARRQLARLSRPMPRPANPGTATTSPNQLGRSFVAARPRMDAVSSHQLGVGPQSGASGQNWPRAV